LFSACSTPEEEIEQFIFEGQKLLETGQPLKARLQFRNALQLDERAAEAWFGLARVSETQSDWPNAFSALERVVELEPQNIEAQLMRGRLLLAGGRLDDVLDVSAMLLATVPENADALALRAAVFFQLDDIEGALRLAREALQHDSAQVDALAVLATERLNSDVPDEALVYLDRALAHDETNAALHLIRIEALTRQGDMGAVEQAHQRLIELFPEERAYRQRLAIFYLEQFRQDDAERVFRGIVDANPEDVQAKRDLVRFINSTRGHDAAVSELERLIESEPGRVDWYLMLAQLYRAADEVMAAEQSLELAAERAEDAGGRHQAMAALAVHRLRSGDYASAEALVDAVLAEDPRNEQAVIIKASRQLDERQFDAAISLLRGALKDNPSAARVLLLLGRAHELQGAGELAEDIYARAFEAGDRGMGYALPYARFLIGKGRAQRAEPVLRDGLRSDPSNVEALGLLARVYISRGDWIGAQRVADRLQELEDREGLGEQVMAAIYAGQQNYDQSIEVLREAYSSAESKTRPMVSLVMTYVQAGRREDALLFVDSVLEANPDNQQARLLKAQLTADAGDLAEAEALLASVIEAEGLVGAYQSLAGLQMRQGRMEEARSTLEEGLEQNPEQPVLRLMLAGALEQLGETEQAIEVYEALLLSQPDTDVAANNLANLLLDTRDDEASYRRALELASRFRTSDIPHFKDTLGWAYFRLGRTQEATSFIREAVESSPSTAVFRYHLGLAHIAADDHAAAREQLDAALALLGESESPLRREVQAAIESL
jgi:tetratricopeptide (TPR) repeat protein